MSSVDISQMESNANGGATVPEIIVSEPGANDIPCTTNRSPKRTPKFIGSSRKPKYALFMPPLKGMPQALRPTIVTSTAIASSPSQADVIDDSRSSVDFGLIQDGVEKGHAIATLSCLPKFIQGGTDMARFEERERQRRDSGLLTVT
ncbi:hypothetical protein CVT24_002551 [Panaeolus cyanescens]|uniref:Uncharacterized protein n=1 Tax=Panaeolus cyanescens TaxID=181874 RepID=A0A409YY52_9AGAR|nr:hypothetical protein CVT24_002551 [Panaeolus cyanescens]